MSDPLEHMTEPLGLAMLPVTLPDTSEQLKAYINNLVGFIVRQAALWYQSESSQVAPLQTQIQLLQAELQSRSSQAADFSMLSAQLRSLQMEVDSLRPQVALVPQLQAEVNQLRQVVSLLAQTSTGMVSAPSEKSLGKARASYVNDVFVFRARSDHVRVHAETRVPLARL